MATWAKKPPEGITTRRKWNLEDRASLNNLKYHFAADGCSDVQYDLGRQLLDNSDLDEASSHAQGVHWLLCAAQQGHEEALDMLQECYKNRRGITESNENDVQTCLSMTPGERAARKAARELFACLSNGGGHITPKQLERKMREIYNLQKRRRHRRHDDSTSEDDDDELERSNDSSSHHRNGIQSNGDIYPSYGHRMFPEDLITEANLVTAAVNYSHGRLPTVNNVLTLSVPHPNSLDHVPCFHRLIFHPLIFFSLLYHRFINVISSLPDLASSNLKIFALFLVYALVSTENLTVFVPILVYYVCLALMIWSTCKMLKSKHDFIDFRIWSGLFLSYGDNNVDAGRSENQFLKNNMRPYLYFFCSFVCSLVAYPMIGNEWLPHSEITVVAFALVFVTMFAFMYTSPRSFPDVLILFSFAVNVLAKYPYEMDEVVTTGWRFLDLKAPTFCSFVIGNGIEFCLSCRAVLYLLIPGFLIHLARRSNWNGTYRYLIPHCVTLSWLQICITSSQSATMFGLVRATLGLAGTLLFLPLFGIVTLLIPVFMTIEWLGLTDPKIRLITTLSAACVALVASCCLAVNQRTQKFVTAFQLILCIVAAALLTLPYMTSNFNPIRSEASIYDSLINDKPTPEREQTLDWEKFYNFCGQPAWERQKQNKIRTQMSCAHLEGATIKWDGTVSDVQITKVSNFRANFVRNYLPVWLGQWIACFYGDKSEVQCTGTEDNATCDGINSHVKEQRVCNLNRWNVYEYEILVRMHAGLLSRPMELHLRASDHFRNFTENLRNSDRVLFAGKLINTHRGRDLVLGTSSPAVELSAIECIVCADGSLTSVEVEAAKSGKLAVNARMRDLARGVKYLLNVLFNPLITFK